jgi:hypothetical protein
MSHRLVTLGVAATAFVALTTACSSGSGAGRDTNTSAAHHAGPVATSTAGASPARSGSGSTGEDAWCAEVEAHGDAVLKGQQDGVAPDPQTARLLVGDAPGAIRDDVQTLVDYETTVAAGRTTGPGVDHFFQSSTHLATWIQAHCPTLAAQLYPVAVSASATS